MEYYIYKDDQQIGPFTLGQLRSMWTSGTLTADTLFWHEGAIDWLPLRTITDTLEHTEAPKQATPSKKQYPHLKGVVVAQTPQRQPIITPALRTTASSQPQTSTSPLTIIFTVSLAILIGGGLLLYGWRSKPQKITGYETKIHFVGESDYSSESEFKRLTQSGWEIKSSRRAWTRKPYAIYDTDKDWGTEYTMQKAVYGK